MRVTVYPKDAETADGLFMNADIALYESKRNGRNQWRFFNPLVRTKLHYRKYLKEILCKALDQNLFNVVFQPIVETSSGRRHGFELLVRLSDNGKPIPPDHFIPVTEELGLITQIGESVLFQAFAEFDRMRKLDLDPGKLAFHAAAQQLTSGGLVECLRDMIFRFNIDTTDLAIEITETALIGQSKDLVSKALEILSKMGLQIALDDFGTGFSSLSHPREFPVDKIKMDKNLVSELEKIQKTLPSSKGSSA